MGSRITTVAVVYILFFSLSMIVPLSGGDSHYFFGEMNDMFNEEKHIALSLASDIWSFKSFIDDINLKQDIKNEFVPGEVIVKFKEETLDKGTWDFSSNLPSLGVPSLNVLNKRYGLLDIQEVSNINSPVALKNVYKLNFPEESDIFDIVEKYESNPSVEYAEPNYIFQTFLTPNDPNFSQQWGLNQSSDFDIDTPDAWDIETGDSNIVVAVVDTGVDYNHTDLAGNIWNNTGETINGIDDDSNGYIDDVRGWDFYYKDNNPMDDYGHGTHCAGIVSAVTNNSVGIAGVCWNCSIMPVKIGGIFEIPLDAAANGITYAADNGADVISMSWGGYFSSSLISDAIDYAYSKGVVLVASAGNSNTDMKSYPAAYDKVIAVAATNQTDSKASFSNYGSWVDVAAPGVSILSTLPSDTYDSLSGTSMACPYVAGLAGLILSKNSSFTQQEVRAILKSSTDTVTSDYYIGIGRINAYQAVLRDSIPLAIINSSLAGSGLVGVVNITGTANGSTFTNYSVSYGAGIYPTNWTEINNSSTRVNDSVLAQWNTSLVDDGTYMLRLLVNDSNSLFAEDRLQVNVNNVISTLHVGGTGPDNYTTIQSAIDDADDGDTIFVHQGTYSENLMISENIDLVGEDRNTTTIDGGIYGWYTTCVWVDAGQCNISNFRLTNSDYGIVYTSSQNSVIKDNLIDNTSYGIYFVTDEGGYGVNNSNFSGGLVYNNKIENNMFTDNLCGVVCWGNYTLVSNNSIDGDYCVVGVACNGDNNTIWNNKIYNQLLYGVYFYNHIYGNISNNIINYCDDYGIYLDEDCNNTIISKNTISGNQNGIYLYGHEEEAGYVVNPIFNDSFEDGNASDWSIYDLSGPGYTWEVDNSCPYWSYFEYKDGTYFLIIDDDDAPWETNNTDSAVTPLVNCSNNSDIYLVFSIDFEDCAGFGEFWVNVSNNNGSSWTNVWNETEDNDTCAVLNISTVADGEEILINFTYDDDDEWAWGALIDGVTVGSSYKYTSHYDNSNTSINYNNIFDNTVYGIYYDSPAAPLINATFNWWGDETGPYNGTSNPNGTGDTVVGPLNYQPWLYHVYPGVKNLNSGQTYTGIQNAINDANNGDTITVYDGTYYENIVINTSVTLQAGSSPIIDGMNNTGISVEANNTIVQNMTVTNSSFGIKVYNSSFTLHDVSLIINTVYNNSGHAIFSTNTSISTISSNHLYNNTGNGIFLQSSSNNSISQNHIYNNSQNGITIKGSSYNSVTSNQFCNNTQIGLSVIDSSSHNTIWLNQIHSHSSYGIYLSASSNNTFYHNNIINNNQQAYDDSNNVWYNSTLLNGNYWNDFDESSEGAYDNNSNGIIDSACNISGDSNQDEYPLASQFENYYVLSIVVSSPVNEETQFTVTVKTEGGTTIQGASVTFNGNAQNTNSNGQITFATPSVSSDTVYQINATKTGYTGDSTTITVKNIESGNGYTPPPSGGGTTGPTAPSNVRCTTPENDNTPSFSWDAVTSSSGIAGYYVKIDDGSDIWIGNVTSWTSTSAIGDGTHTFYVKAKDASSNGNVGSYGSCSFTIDMSIIGDSPVADAGGPYAGLTFQTITFDGSGSYDPDEDIINYTWNFGDGTTGYGIKPTHSYVTAGLYILKLTVTDEVGLKDTGTTTVNITLDSDADGWSDIDEDYYGTNVNNSNDCPLDTDSDRIPDDYDYDDDNDGLEDHLEKTLGSNPKNKSDVINITLDGKTHYLIDSDGDGLSDKFYNSTGRITTIGISDDEKYLIDIDGDGKWNYIYDPASGEVTPYKEKSSEEFPWLLVIIGIIIAIIVIIIVLFLTGYIRIEEEYVEEEWSIDDYKN